MSDATFRAICMVAIMGIAPFLTMCSTNDDICRAAAPSPFKWQDCGGFSPILTPGGSWDKDMMVCGCLLFDGSIYTLYYTGKNSTNYPMIGIATSANTKAGWTFYQNNPVFGCGSSGAWDAQGVWGPCVLIDGSTYKMWYGGYNGTSWSIGYATSTDGKNWSRDVASPVLVPGTGAEWDRTSVYYPYVIKDTGGYRMWYAGYNSSKGCIGYATSSNGINWTKYPQNPVLSPSGVNNFYKTAVFSPCVLNISGEYRMYFTGHDGSSYQVGYANSSDAANWDIYDQQILKLGSSWENYLHRNPAVVFNGSAYLMMYTAGNSADRVGEAEGWNNVPLAPTWYFPANNTFTQDATPSMSWYPRDFDSDDVQTAFQVQFDDDQYFTTIDRDTGKAPGDNTSYEVLPPLPDGRYFFRVRTWDSDNDFGEWSSMLRISIDTTPPINPTLLSSTSHVPGKWSNDPNITVTWSGASDATTGLAGYSILWDHSADAIPDGTSDLGAGVVQNTSAPMMESSSTYFHIRSVDYMGLAAPGARTIGPFLIDRGPPVNPVVNCTTHHAGAWSNNSEVKVCWDGANDTGSGVADYSFIWDGSCATVPDTVPECNFSVVNATSPGLTEGSWYFHIRTADQLGNWALDASHFGPVLIDYSPPWNPLSVTSPDHVPGAWSANARVLVVWTGADDTHSQISEYSFVWDSSSNTLPDEKADCGGSICQTSSPALPDGTNNFFHIRVRDSAGNWNATAVHCGPFWIDTSLPENPVNLRSTSHQLGQWSRNGQVSVEWFFPPVGDNRCGYGGVSAIWSVSNSTVPDLKIDINASVTSMVSPPLASGTSHYFHIRALNILGTWACETVHLGPFYIDYVPPANPRALVSTDHGPSDWSNSSTIGVAWIPGEDPLSGIAGYSLLWDQMPRSLPLENITASAPANRTTSPVLPDAAGWYFHMRAADNAGNWAPTATHAGPFPIDSAPPIVGEFHINGGAPYATNSSIVLEVAATDRSAGSGLAGMRFKVGDDDWTQWEPFLPCKNMTLDRKDGNVLVLVQVMDRANNTSPARSCAIFLDRSPPAVAGLKINGGAPITNATEVMLSISAADSSPGSGLAGISLSRDGVHWEGWEPYRETRPFSMSGADGLQQVYLRARDLAGLESPPVEAEIAVDRQAPEESSISIDGGAWAIKTTTVRLDLGSRDPQPGSGIGSMSFSENGALWTDWEDYRSSCNYTFSPDNGLRTILFRTRDRAQNIGDAVHASIYLDTAPPTVLWSELFGSNGSNASLAIALSEPARVVLEYGLSVSYNMSAGSDVQGAFHILNLTDVQPGGTYHYTLTATDAVGNMAPRTADATFSVPAPPEPRIPHVQKPAPLGSGVVVQSSIAAVLVAAAVIMGVMVRRMSRQPRQPPASGGEPHG